MLPGWIGLSLLLAAPAAAESAAGRHERFIAYLKEQAAAISARSLTEVASIEAWQQQRPETLRRLRSMLGLDPLPERTPLRAQVTGTLQRPSYHIEKLVFQSMPGLYVTGNLYLPRQTAGPLPTILYACGHNPHPLGAKWDYQDRGQWFAAHGYVCLVLDTLEFGEVPGIHHGIHDLNMWDWLSLGYTPIGVEVWNAMRALDYLETRPEVDPKRIGMTGISGGGAATWFTAAVDERIAAAVPVCSTYTFGSQAAHWVAAGQCDCIYFHNTFLSDFPIVGALIAPRPLMLCSGRKDGDFPPDGYHEVYRRVKGIYDLYAGPGGAPARIREVDADVGHTDAPLFRAETRLWLNRWLKGDATPLTEELVDTAPRETPEDLACLTRLPADATNASIHDRFIATARLVVPADRAEWVGRRTVLLRRLKEEVFGWFPSAAIPFATRVTGHQGGWAARYADYREVLFDSEAGMPIRAQLLQPRGRPKTAPLLVYVKRPGDSIHPFDIDELLPVFGRYSVLILNPRMTEQSVTGRELADIERTASWIGRTVASMHVWDTLRAVEWATKEEGLTPDTIALYGKGETGILCVYAGLLDERIAQVILRDPPTSHRQGPALLNVLRVTDIPEVAGAFAPRRLVFLRERPAGLDLTAAIYQLLGQPERLSQAGSLPEALEVWKY
jgi:cephalosporin-C deacetylase-like acetyl esterase